METKKKTNKFKLKLETAGETFTSEGKTILEAIEKMPVSYIQIKYKGLFTLTQGTKTATRFMYRPQLRRVFLNKLCRVYLADNLNYMI